MRRFSAPAVRLEQDLAALRQQNEARWQPSIHSVLWPSLVVSGPGIGVTMGAWGQRQVEELQRDFELKEQKVAEELRTGRCGSASSKSELGLDQRIQ